MSPMCLPRGAVSSPTGGQRRSAGRPPQLQTTASAEAALVAATPGHATPGHGINRGIKLSESERTSGLRIPVTTAFRTVRDPVARARFPYPASREIPWFKGYSARANGVRYQRGINCPGRHANFGPRVRRRPDVVRPAGQLRRWVVVPAMAGARPVTHPQESIGKAKSCRRALRQHWD